MAIVIGEVKLKARALTLAASSVEQMWGRESEAWIGEGDSQENNPELLFDLATLAHLAAELDAMLSDKQEAK